MYGAQTTSSNDKQKQLPLRPSILKNGSTFLNDNSRIAETSSIQKLPEMSNHNTEVTNRVMVQDNGDESDLDFQNIKLESTEVDLKTIREIDGY